MKLEGSAACRNVAQTAIESLTSLGVRDTVLPAFSPSSARPDRSGQSMTNNLPARIRQLSANYFNSGFRLIDTGPNPKIRNSLLIAGHTSLLQSLLNSNPNFCSSDEGFELSSLLPKNSLHQPKLFLKIQSLDYQTQIYSCPTGYISLFPQRAVNQVPTDVSNDGFEIVGNPLKALSATITIHHLENDQLSKCQASNIYQHQRDGTNSSPRPTATATTGTGKILGSANRNTSCNTDSPGSSTYRNITLKLRFEGAEPGSVFICRDASPSAADARWYACDQIRLRGTLASTVGFTNVGENPEITLNYLDLPTDQKYVLDFASVDTAGNRSAIGTYIFYVDATRPTIQSVNIAADEVDVGPVGDGIAGRNAPPATVNWSTNVIQCNNRTVSAQATYGGTLSDNWMGCLCSSDLGISNDTSGICPYSGTCLATTQAAATHGTHSIAFVAGDVCGYNFSATDSYIWDTVLTFTPGRAPHRINASAFQPGTSAPYYEMTLPDPAPAPKHFAALCDCNPVPLTENDLTCGAEVDHGANGCLPAAFESLVFDICGRRREFSTATGNYARYEVLSGLADGCRNQVCANNLTCCGPGLSCDYGECISSPGPRGPEPGAPINKQNLQCPKRGLGCSGVVTTTFTTTTTTTSTLSTTTTNGGGSSTTTSTTMMTTTTVVRASGTVQTTSSSSCGYLCMTAGVPDPQYWDFTCASLIALDPVYQGCSIVSSQPLPPLANTCVNSCTGFCQYAGATCVRVYLRTQECTLNCP